MKLSLLERCKEKGSRILGCLALLLAICLLFYFEPIYLKKSFSALDNWSYDTTVRFFAKPLKADSPIAIIDIDDKSLEEVGRWPWPRNILADLAQKLFQKGALVVAWDALFSEAEQNPLTEVASSLEKTKFDKQALGLLQKEASLFDYDKQFAEALAKGPSVLPLVFSNFDESIGVLPNPMLTLSPQQKEGLPIDFYKNYLSNVASLEAAAAAGGFINAFLDEDGNARYAGLLLGLADDLYGSLGFVAAAIYLLEDKVTLDVKNYGGQKVIEAIHLGDEVIPTDSSGRMLIPFRGPSYTFPYLSATDILHDRISADKIVNRLLFVGSSASGWKDVFPTALDPVFPGAEIHASVAAGIIDHYLPTAPAWDKGLLLLLMISFGLLFTLLLPHIGALLSTLIMLMTIAALVLLQLLLWIKGALFISVVIPCLTLFLLYLFQEILGYFTETIRRKELKEVFGQYVPSMHIDRMMHAKNVLDLAGENKELSVFFSDIRNFTSMSEKLTAPEIKQLLNEYLTPMTQVIFEHMGTIDKYVGDMIMAFWGAPLQDEQHALHAVKAALAMQQKLSELNRTFSAQKGLEIHIGIGVNTGLMNVGDMGSKFRRAYTVLGDAVNTASRMESVTKYYHVPNIISESTMEKTKNEIIYRKLDRVRLKGKENAIFIYEALAEKTHWQSSLQPLLDLHHEGLEHYFAQNWEAAAKIFTELKEKVPERKEYYDLFLSRIETFRNAAPSEDWQGVHILESK